ncbi:MAG: DUF1775 domain-containing protein [Acidimicrobiia bacterium]|nr:DUF1775 domain-containing protein [Acidimicrobiia bacterium]
MLTLTVPHGCGEAPTSELTVQLPDSLQSVKAEAVPGWSSAYEMADLDEPYELHGTTITEYVDTITWTATGDRSPPTSTSPSASTSAPPMRWASASSCRSSNAAPTGPKSPGSTRIPPRTVRRQPSSSSPPPVVDTERPTLPCPTTRPPTSPAARRRAAPTPAAPTTAPMP